MIDRNDIQGLAAEYVIGTLSDDERQEVSSARSTLPALNSAITEWERTLAPLLDCVPTKAPSPDLLAKIERQLFGALNELPDRNALVRQAHNWRFMAFAASIGLIIVSSIAVQMSQISEAPLPPAIALLQKETTTPAFLVTLNEKTLTLTIRPIAAAPDPTLSYQLWLIMPHAATPSSLGILPVTTSRQIRLTGIDPDQLREATLAVSLEPHGGSPTGLPTGPVVFRGNFLHARL